MMILDKKYKKILAEPRINATSTEHFRALLFDAVNTVAEMMKIKARLVELTFSELEKKEYVSNSHNSPVGGVYNWCGTYDDRPSGYPGWEGNVALIIKAKYISDKDYYSTIRDLIDEAEGFNTGSGGSGGGSDPKKNLHGLRYTIRLFEQDFPGMRGAMLAEKLAIT